MVRLDEVQYKFITLCIGATKAIRSREIEGSRRNVPGEGDMTRSIILQHFCGMHVPEFYEVPSLLVAALAVDVPEAKASVSNIITKKSPDADTTFEHLLRKELTSCSSWNL